MTDRGRLPLAHRPSTICVLVIACAIAIVGAQTSDRARTESQARRANARLVALQREADELANQQRSLLVDLRRLEVERDLKTEQLRQIQADAQQGCARARQHRQSNRRARGRDRGVRTDPRSAHGRALQAGQRRLRAAALQCIRLERVRTRLSDGCGGRGDRSPSSRPAQAESLAAACRARRAREAAGRDVEAAASGRRGARSRRARRRVARTAHRANRLTPRSHGRARRRAPDRAAQAAADAQRDEHGRAAARRRRLCAPDSPVSRRSRLARDRPHADIVRTPRIRRHCRARPRTAYSSRRRKAPPFVRFTTVRSSMPARSRGTARLSSSITAHRHFRCTASSGRPRPNATPKWNVVTRSARQAACSPESPACTSRCASTASRSIR